MALAPEHPALSFAACLERCAVPALWTDAAGQLLGHNEAMAELLGPASAELLLAPIPPGLWPQPDSPVLHHTIEEALARRRSWQGVIHLRDLGDGGRWVRLSVHPLAAGPGERPGRLVLAEPTGGSASAPGDLAGLSGAEILGQTGDAVFVTDLGGRIMAWLGGCQRLFGHTFAEVRGRHISEVLYSPGERDALRSRIREHLVAGQVFSGEIECATKDGRTVRCLATVSQVRSHDGQPVATLGIYKDVTAQRRREQEIVRDQQIESLGRLASSIAHGFNNALVGVLGYASLIQSRLPPGDELHRLVEKIEHAAERAARLTHQLLAYSKSGPTVRRPLDLNTLVREALVVLQASVPGSTRIVTELAPGPAVVMADPVQLQQALLNLTANASEAMSPGGTMTISTRRAAGHAILEVRDTGAGMDQETLARAAEPFFTTKELGRGLGLAAATGIAAQHGGQLEIRSAPGAGTAVTLSLPLAADAGDGEHRRSAVDARTVLVVEDDSVIREFVCAVFIEMGHRVLAAPGSLDAVRMLAAHEGGIDLLVVDQILPGSLGSDLIRRVRRSHPRLPVLLLSAQGAERAMELPLADPHIEVVPKPFRLNDLEAAAARILGPQR